MSRRMEEAVLRDNARRAAAMNAADAKHDPIVKSIVDKMYGDDDAATNGGSVRAATWRDVPMQRRCERENVVTDGHLTTASDALWWTCGSCDLEVDVTDEVRAFFKGAS